ncbi:hypothetical protein [Acinetobacter baumannii]|nr:hypothetical protein [Acinetobacter baumannii]
MKHIVEFTHYGWVGICPVMFSELESGSPIIEPRFKLVWLMMLSEFLIDLYINFKVQRDAEYEPMYPMLIKGEYKKPKRVEFEIKE